MGPLDIDLIFPNGLVLDDAFRLLQPLLIVVIGMAAYAVFVFKFYRFLAARDVFNLNLSQNDAVRGAVFWDLVFLAWYAVRYVILMPAFAFIWFAVLTLILVFLSEDRQLSNMLLISMATVCAVRVSAYYSEELSRDLAKILPFAVLGVFIIDSSFFALEASLAALGEIGAHLDVIVYYMLFLVALEFALRFIYIILKLLFPDRKESETAPRRSRRQARDPALQLGRHSPAGRNVAPERQHPAAGSDAAEPEVGAGQQSA